MNNEKQASKGFKVQYKSLLSGAWVDSYLPHFTTEVRAENAGKKELPDYETKAVSLAESQS